MPLAIPKRRTAVKSPFLPWAEMTCGALTPTSRICDCTCISQLLYQHLTCRSTHNSGPATDRRIIINYTTQCWTSALGNSRRFRLAVPRCLEGYRRDHASPASRRRWQGELHLHGMASYEPPKPPCLTLTYNAVSRAIWHLQVPDRTGGSDAA